MKTCVTCLKKAEDKIRTKVIIKALDDDKVLSEGVICKTCRSNLIVGKMIGRMLYNYKVVFTDEERSNGG